MSVRNNVPLVRSGLEAPRRALRERGMATVEYALGVVVVIVLIGAIVVAINTNTFGELLEAFLRALMTWIGQAFELPFPIKP